MSNHPTPYPSGIYACSIVGRVRDHNEDAVLARSWTDYDRGPLGLQALLAVADGMGGHQRGEWASDTALTVLMNELSKSDSSSSLAEGIEHAVTMANKTIYEGSDGSGSAHPGTTLSLVAVTGQRCIIANIGDSRVYLLRNGTLKQMTKDDTWAAELVNRGKMTEEESANWVHRNQLTKALGISSTIELEPDMMDIKSGDVLLLCSDGLSGMISDKEIQRITAGSHSAAQAAELLCKAAEEAGGEDNISVVIYSHGSWSPQPAVFENRPESADGRTATVSAQPRVRSRRPSIHPIVGLLVCAVLLGAGFKLLTYRPNKPATGVRPNIPAKSPATPVPSGVAFSPTEKRPSPPPSQPDPGVIGQNFVGIVVRLDDAKKTLKVTSAGGTRIQGKLVAGNSRWEPISCEYEFKVFRISKKKFAKDDHPLRLVGPSGSDILFVRDPSDGSLHAETSMSGEYSLDWLGLRVPTIGKFRVEVPQSSEH